MELQIFEFNEREIRVTLDENQTPVFIARDVCDVLDIKNSRDALASLDGDEKGVAITDTLGGRQEVAFVTEPGLYSLIFRSRKPEAKLFKRWVTHEVLPSIRKHGMYATPVTLENMVANPDWAIGLLQNLKFEQEKRALAESQRDKAIATKAEIGTRREATSMATASAAVRKANKLEDELGIGKTYRSTRSIPWVKEFFAPSRGMWITLGKKLSALSIEMDRDVRKVNDEKYGFVNSYHKDVIKEMRRRVEADNNMLGRYRP